MAELTLSADAGGTGTWPSPSLPPSSPPSQEPRPHSLLLSFMSLMLVELGLVSAARDFPSSVKQGVGTPSPPHDFFSEWSCRVSSGNTQLMLAVILSRHPVERRSVGPGMGSPSSRHREVGESGLPGRARLASEGPWRWPIPSLEGCERGSGPWLHAGLHEPGPGLRGLCGL